MWKHGQWQSSLVQRQRCKSCFCRREFAEFVLTYSRLLDDSRSLERYELSAPIRSALTVKGVTSLTPLQEQTVGTLVGREKAWYIQRPGDHNNPRTFQLVGSKKPENLAEGENAVQGVLTVNARQDLICLAETGESFPSLGT